MAKKESDRHCLVRLFHRHEWAYALGISPGVTDGRPRPLCFRRACPVCGRREEIEHYGRVVMVDGVKYMADPCWRESEPNAGRTPADQEKRAAGVSPQLLSSCSNAMPTAVSHPLEAEILELVKGGKQTPASLLEHFLQQDHERREISRAILNLLSPEDGRRMRLNANGYLSVVERKRLGLKIRRRVKT